MTRFLTILTILAFSASQGFATPLDLVVTGGDLETSIPGAASDVIPASMPLSTSSSAVFSSISSSATYEFSNSGGVASFDIQPVTQSAIWDSNMNVGATMVAKGIVIFELNEAADYSVSGAYSGSSDIPSVDFQSISLLIDEANSSFVFVESEFSVQPANHVVNGLDDGNTGNAGNFTLIGSSTGTLLPGNYSYEYRLILSDAGFEFGSGNAAGSANLTLTRVIPEPASAVLMLLGLGAVICARNRSLYFTKVLESRFGERG